MDCIFCKIVDGELPANKVFENETIVAFYDIEPQAPVHVLIIPKKHITSVDTLKEEELPLMGDLHKAAQQIARELGVHETGYRLISNHAADSGQIVFHLHYHLLAGENLGPLRSK